MTEWCYSALNFLPVVLLLAVVNIYQGGQLHCCPLETCVCMAVHGPIPVTPLKQQQCAHFDPFPLASYQVPRSGWTPPHHPQGRGVWWRPLLWGVLQWGGVLWRWQYAVRGQVILFLTVLLAHVGKLRIGNMHTCKIFILLYMFTGIRTVTQSMRLPKVTITLTFTMTMTNSLSTMTHGGHQRDGCFLQLLKVSFYTLQHELHVKGSFVKTDVVQFRKYQSNWCWFINFKKGFCLLLQNNFSCLHVYIQFSKNNINEKLY